MDRLHDRHPPAVAFTAAEITDAYAVFHEKVAVMAETGDWTGYADLFTPDAEYVEHAMVPSTAVTRSGSGRCGR